LILFRQKNPSESCLGAERAEEIVRDTRAVHLFGIAIAETEAFRLIFG
jgi:hypothetical protein